MLSGPARAQEEDLQTIRLDQSEFDGRAKSQSQQTGGQSLGNATPVRAVEERPKKGPPTKRIMNGNPPKGSGKAKKNFVADHDPPLIVRHYAGGCHDDAAKRKADAETAAGIKTHCTKCSSKQGNATGSERRSSGAEESARLLMIRP